MIVSRIVVLTLFVAAGGARAQSLIEDLDWAYAISPAAEFPDDGRRYTVPDSDRSFTRAEIANRQGPGDWHPGDHPAMPPIVAVGRESAGIWACSLCHYPNGKGRPENAGVAGLTPEYFERQLRDFAAGRRTSADNRKANTGFMVAYAVAMTDEEISAAAEYFAAMPWSPWIEVIETDVVPKTEILGGMHIVLDGEEAGEEPIGRRIVETPRDAERTELLRDPRSGFIAYAPLGSVAAGESLATTGGGKSIACAVCHGEQLDGLAFVPGLRGRSPSYIARQLADFKLDTRRGAWSPLMAEVVAELTADDILNLSAYLASLPVE